MEKIIEWLKNLWNKIINIFKKEIYDTMANKNKCPTMIYPMKKYVDELSKKIDDIRVTKV